jgi:signal transduction histidine kinase
MLRRLGIRAKVLAVLALPVIVLLLTAGFITVQSVGEARTAGTVSEVVAVLPAYARAAEALQQERTLSVQKAGDDDLGGNINASRSATDDAIAALGVALRDVDLSGLDARVAQAVQNASNQHESIVELRDRVDAGSIPPTLVDSNYTSVVRADNNVPVVVAETLSERSLASQMTAYGAIADTIEQVLRAQPVASDVLRDNGTDAGQVRELAGLFAVQDEHRSEARDITNNLRLDGIQLPSRDADLTAMQLAMVSGTELAVSVLDQTRWNTLVNAELATLRPVATDLLESATDRADRLAQQAREQTILTVGITLAAAALSIVIAFVVSRGIVVPMRRLTAAAGTVREELPRLVEQVAVPGESPDLTLADIPVESEDEVGRLAQAFNDVNATTLQVAREQAALRGSIAEMFVNVARRDQVLLGRQLSFIDSLERSEEDPATLANLFRLDHLATRMRRNAESLLVLAGIDSGRRLREAMPLSDVVRTASSEIEQYDRVQLELNADPLMHGFNALAAAHLLAELLENATLFSEPGTPVVVATGVDGDQVVVRITDQGLGMSPDELTEANHTIASTSPTEALGAQRLGLFVVARLAQRLGAKVRLERASVSGMSGTIATVSFPVGLFTANDPALAGPAAGERSGGLRTGSLPEVDAPVAVPVDLAALTDGATTTGLPRRRTSDAPDASPAPAARRDLPTEQDVVLPAPAETTLAPEIAAEASGWTPLVAPAPDAPAPLASRGSLPTRGGGLPSRTPAPAPDDTPAEAPAAPAGPRTSLFSGFRGREAAAAAAQDAGAAALAPVDPIAEAGREVPGTAEPVTAPAGFVPSDAPVEAEADRPGPVDAEPELSAADHARLDALSAPLTAGSAFDQAPAFDQVPADDEAPAFGQAPAADEAPAELADSPEPEVAPETETAEHETAVPETAVPEAAVPAPLVVPGLVPDEPLDEARAWGGWAEPAAAPAPAEPEPVWSGSAWSEPAGTDAPVGPDAPVVPTLDSPLAWSGDVAPIAEQPAAASFDAPIGRADETQLFPPVPDAVDASAPVVEPAPAAQPFAAAPIAPAFPPPAAPVAAAPVTAPPVTAPPAPAVPAAPPAPATATPSDAPALPDFATLVRGDDEPAAEPARRERARRSFFSFRRKGADPAPARAEAPPAPAAVPAWPATSAPTPVAPVAPAAATPAQAPQVPAPAVPAAPVNPVPAPVVSQSWLPAAAWAPVEEQPASAAAPGWPAPAQETADSAAPAAESGWLSSPGWGATPAAEQPSAPAWGQPVPEQPAAPAQPAAFGQPAFGQPAPGQPAAAWPPAAETPSAAQLPAEPAWAPEAPAAAVPLPTRTRGVVPPPAPEPAAAAPAADRRPHRDISAWASSWSPDGGVVPQPSAAPSWSAQPSPSAEGAAPAEPPARRPGAMDTEAAAMLSLRADIQEQALSELSQLSAYRPQVVDRPANGSLTRRVPTAIPAAPEISTPDAGEAPARDADGLRNRLSSFQSGTRRGRRALGEPDQGQTDHEPRTEPDHQPVPPSPSW